VAFLELGDVTYVDRFDRADGTAWTGSALWATTGRDGSASELIVASNRLSVSSSGGGLSTESLADFNRGFRVVTLGGGFGVTFGYRFTGSGATSNGYFWSLAGGTWKLYRVTAGTPTEIGSQSVDGLFTNSRFLVRAVGSTHEIYAGTSRIIGPSPVASFTDGTYTGAGAVSVELDSGAWALDDYFTASLVAPSSGVTIIVDPDHAASSDDYNRTQASNASTPMRTVQEAGWLARAGAGWHDEILVKLCTTEDLGDATDPHLQPALDYRSVDRGATADGWPLGNNAGNQTIVVRGDVTPLNVLAWDGLFDDVPRPKIKSFSSRDLNNWAFEDLQFGYDVGSGADYNTFGQHERCTDLAFRRCMATGGLAWVRHWSDSFIEDRCWIRSPFPPSGQESGVHDACGLRLDGSPAEGTGYSVGQLHVSGGFRDFIRGDDSIFVGGVDSEADPLWDVFDVLVETTVFYNVNGDGEFHDDCVQVTFAPRATVDRCMFIGCDTGFMATDGHCGYLQFTRNLTVGMPTPVQIQGTDEVLIAHNTCSHADGVPKDASLMFYDRAVLSDRTVATIVNNVIGGFYTPNTPLASYFRADSVIENNIVQSSPGLVTPYGTNLPGIAELGHSARLDVIPNDSTAYGRALDRYWELANSPTPGPGIAEGGVYVTGVDLSTDLFGRPYATSRDVGALQSDPGTLVTPTPRGPYILSRTPAVSAVAVDPSVSPVVALYPVPGQEIDADTISNLSAYVTDPAGFKLPAVITLAAPDLTGAQELALDLKGQTDPTVVEGDLYPLVVYTVHLTGAIEDTQGSALTATTWTFRVVGPSGAAIGDGTSGEPPTGTHTMLSRWPVGTTVSVYRFVPDVPGPPSGPAVTTAVTGASTVTFSDIQLGVRHVAYALGVSVTFLVPAPAFRTVRVS
jgi:hypothetical protein